MTNTYANRSNANRAAKKFNEKFDAPYTITGDKQSGFQVVITCSNEALTEVARAAGFATEDYYTVTADDLTELGQYGVGTNEDDAACPHCGINHIGNGYAGYDCNDDQVANGAELFMHEYVCLGCNGGWGAELVSGDFAQLMDQYKAAGNSKCASLRFTARDMSNVGCTRKSFIADAMQYGIKEATASANWACMKRGEF